MFTSFNLNIHYYLCVIVLVNILKTSNVSYIRKVIIFPHYKNSNAVYFQHTYSDMNVIEL